MEIRYETTKRQLEEDLPRILSYIDTFDALKEMCMNCENWYGDEHNYEECMDMPCFTFFRAFEFLEFWNSYTENPE